MQITVIVCTRNRAEQLRRTLESATAIDAPSGLSWELLVVDNGSSDQTPQAVESFIGRLPIRRVSEPKAGLSNARNRGVSEAKGAYICWTDDDVLIDRNWLAAYADAFVRHPEAAYFGGPIELVLEGPTPSWFEDNRELLGPILAERRFGDVPIPLEPAADIIPYGANYAVRVREQRMHSYDPNLGVSPTQRRLGEETTLLAAIDEAGGTGWWVPDARVRHIIPQDRQSMAYLAEYRRAAGETSAYLAEHGPPALAARSMRLSRWPFRGAPVLWCFMFGHLALHHVLSWLRRSPASLRHYLRSAYYGGALNYSRHRG
jgi:glycosyltransferase involved in cell wall biosynthesis